MSTERQRQASRVNGAKSQGPVTAGGKARSAQNATIHGFAANAAVLRCEPNEEFESFRGALWGDLQPASAVELEVFEQYVAALWRDKRVVAMQAALMDLEIGRQADAIKDRFESIDPATCMALAFEKLVEKNSTLELLHRYEARHERAARSALTLLLALQKQRTAERTRQPASPVESAPSQPDSALPPVSDPSPGSSPVISWGDVPDARRDP